MVDLPKSKLKEKGSWHYMFQTYYQRPGPTVYILFTHERESTHSLKIVKTPVMVTHSGRWAKYWVKDKPDERSMQEVRWMKKDYFTGPLKQGEHGKAKEK